MGKLKPIGSEKLTGVEKIQRMIEISRYNESIPQPINEDKSVEYSINLSDGNKYIIVREKVGYVIKKTLTESNEESYLEPMKNRKYYSSYSQAFKRLNLIAKELNSLNENVKNISLFTEGDDEKFYLKVESETNEQAQLPAPAPVSAPSTPASEPETQMTQDEIPSDVPTDSELPQEMEKPSSEMEPSAEEETDEVVTMKTLQKLTGKLSQKIREFSSNEENNLDSKDIKYIINSILSALNLSDLDNEDKDEIVSKFEGTQESDSELSSDEIESEDSSTETGEESSDMTPEVPQEPEVEMTEESDDFQASKMRRKRHHMSNMEPHHSDKVEEFFEGVFNESKIDKVIGKYFQLSENEKKTQENTIQISKNIRKHSTTIIQEVASKKFVKQNPEAKLIGRSKKNNLVFSLNEEKVRITPNGNIL